MRTKEDINILKHFTNVFPLDDGHERMISNREMYYLFAGVIDGAKNEPFFKNNWKYFFLSFEVHNVMRGNSYYAISGEFNMSDINAVLKKKHKIQEDKNIHITFIREVTEEEFNANNSKK